jgi:hypothetical protein
VYGHPTSRIDDFLAESGRRTAGTEFALSRDDDKSGESCLSVPGRAMSTPQEAPALTEADFERLFGFLDADVKRASAKYDQIRLRLNKLFTWRDCAPARTFADQAIERVVRKVNEGEHRVAEPFQFFYSTAMGIVQEQAAARAAETAAKPADAPLPLDEFDTPLQRPSKDPVMLAEARKRLPYVQGYLDDLLPKYRRLLTEYHRRTTSVRRRDELAQANAAPLSALRLRVHRLRNAIERAVSADLHQRVDGPDTSHQEGLLT